VPALVNGRPPCASCAGCTTSPRPLRLVPPVSRQPIRPANATSGTRRSLSPPGARDDGHLWQVPEDTATGRTAIRQAEPRWPTCRIAGTGPVPYTPLSRVAACQTRQSKWPGYLVEASADPCPSAVRVDGHGDWVNLLADLGSRPLRRFPSAGQRAVSGRRGRRSGESQDGCRE
jgi:hypothetical protein